MKKRTWQQLMENTRHHCDRCQQQARWMQAACCGERARYVCDEHKPVSK